MLYIFVKHFLLSMSQLDQILSQDLYFVYKLRDSELKSLLSVLKL